jgi:hypothetical protein
VANNMAEVCWFRQLLVELHNLLPRVNLIYYDNVITVYLSINIVQHQHAKHVQIDLYFIREYVAADDIHVLYVPMIS